MTRIFRKRTRRNYGYDHRKPYDQRKQRPELVSSDSPRRDERMREEQAHEGRMREEQAHEEEDQVDESSMESFPASDAPSWTPGSAKIAGSAKVDSSPKVAEIETGPGHKKRYIVTNKPHRPILKRRPEHIS